MITLQVDVNIGGNDVSDYVVSIERQHSICDTTATGIVTLSSDFGGTIDPYDQVVIYEQGTKVFTGFVNGVNRGRVPVEYTVEISDPSIKLQDYWLEQEYRSAGETAEYWIGFFCDLAGVSHTFDHEHNRIVPEVKPDEYGWQYSSAMDVIKELLVIGGFHMSSFPDGVIHFSNQEIGSLGKSLSPIRINRDRSTDGSRNKAIVFGRYPIVAEMTLPLDELGDRGKTAVVASRHIESETYASSIAGEMLAHFSRIDDVKTVDAEGDPDYRVGYRVGLSDSWMNLSGDALITTIRSNISDSGYIMTLVLDQFCPFIWGYYKLVTITLYASTDGFGIYRSDNLGVTWSGINDTLPSGAYWVRGITASGEVVWAATVSGVFQTKVGGNNWVNKTPPLPVAVTMADWTDIEMDPNDSDTVYTLMDDIDNHRVYLHKSDDDGASWSYVEIV